MVIILAVLGFAVGAGWVLTRSKVGPTPSTPSTPRVNTSATPKTNPVNVSQRGAEPPHSVGMPDAAVTLEEFGDFQCPPCGLLHPVLKEMEKEFGPRLRVIFREYPLVPTHPHALTAARAAEAAGLQGKFWQMHDMLFTNQRTWHTAFDARPVFEGYAVKIGLDMEKFKRDINGSVVERAFPLMKARACSRRQRYSNGVHEWREIPFESLAPEKLRPLNRSRVQRPPVVNFGCGAFSFECGALSPLFTAQSQITATLASFVSICVASWIVFHMAYDPRNNRSITNYAKANRRSLKTCPKT